MYGLIPDFLQDLGQQIGNFWPVMIALLAIGAVARRGVKYIVDNQTELIMDQVDNRIDPIEEQFQVNGGSTVKDALNRIESNQQITISRNEKTAESLTEIGLKLDLLSLSHEITSAKVRALTMSLPNLGFWSTDSDGKVVEANKAYIDIWHFDDFSQVTSDEWLLQLTDDSRKLAEERLVSILENPRQWIFTMEKKTGETLRIAGWPIVVGDNFEGYTGTLEVINESN